MLLLYFINHINNEFLNVAPKKFDIIKFKFYYTFYYTFENIFLKNLWFLYYYYYYNSSIYLASYF